MIDTKESPLVILAFDACDPDLVTRWASQGYLPTLASVMERGFWGKISTSEQVLEQGSWISLLSGVSPNEHGYYDFRRLQPGTYDLQLGKPVEVAARPFWAALKGSNKKVAILDAPEVGVVRGLPGIQLVDWATHQTYQTERAAATEPKQLMQEVRRLFGPQIPLRAVSNRKGLRKERKMYRRFLERIEKKGTLCRHLLKRDQYDLVVIGFHEAHTGAHLFWDYCAQDQEGGDSVDAGDLRHAIRNIYSAIDRELGLLLSQLSQDANVCVVSMFGMKDQYPMTGISEALCRCLGYQASPAAGSPSFKPLEVSRYVIPKRWRVAASRRLPPMVQERLLADWFRNSTNWNQTTAFAIPSLYTSYIRVNLQGREPLGTIAPGPEYEALLNRLEDDFRRIVDPRSGDALVSDFIRVADRFGREPPHWLPDLLVQWHASKRFFERAVHPKAELTQVRPGYFRSSYHALQGFFAVAGPNMRSLLPFPDASLLDLAPTFLTLLGQPVPESMVGQLSRSMIYGYS